MFLFLILMLVLLFLLVLGLALSSDNRDDRMQLLRERLELVERAEKRQERVSLALLRDDLLSEIPALNRWLQRLGRGQALRTWLRQAAITTRPGKFMLLAAACGIACATMAVPLAPWYGVPLAAAAGAAVPFAWARRQRNRRLAAFQLQLPEAIDLLTRASRAGHPPSAALELIATEMPEPLAGEVRQLFDQQRFGLPLRDCLLNMADRVPLMDVRFLATAMIMQRESGGNLAEILENLSHLIRERIKILRQVKTHTAQGRMTLWVLMGLAPCLLVALMFVSRAFVLPMFTNPMGQLMLGVGAGLQIIGLFLLRRIVNIEV